MSVTAGKACPAQEAVSKMCAGTVQHECDGMNAIKTQIRDALGRYFFEKDEAQADDSSYHSVR